MDKIYGSIELRSGGKLEIVAATRDQIPELTALEDRSINPEIFARITEDEFAESVENDLVLVAKDGGGIWALCVLVKNRACERSLAADVGDSFDKTVTFDGVIVAPEMRGNGLQRRFLSIAEAEARAMGARWLAATVAPTNIPSRRNFAAMGFSELREAPKYGSVRIIVAKELL